MYTENLLKTSPLSAFCLVLVFILTAGCSSTSKNGSPVNMWARSARLGDIETLTHLAKEQNRNFDEVDTNGLTALMIASRHGQVEMVRFLLSHKVDANRVDHDGQSALEYALLGNAPTVQKKEIAHLLLVHGADPFRANAFGSIAVYDLVTENFLEEIKLLNFSLHSPCDRLPRQNSKNSTETSPQTSPQTSIVQLALINGHQELAKYLESLGCR